MAACFHQNMGVLNIRVWAGGVLASSERPDRLFVMTTGTDLDNEVRCAAAVRTALGDTYGTPAQAALRFVLGQPRPGGAGDRNQQDRPARRRDRGGGAGSAADGGDLQARHAVGERVQRRLTPSDDMHYSA